MVKLSEQRIAICRECEFYESLLSRCKKCGCFLAVKTLIKNADCPLGKWKRKVRNMAYFAELDFDNVVKQVVVLDDSVIGESVFPESEPLGVEFLRTLYGQQTVWKQTSPTGEFRHYFAYVSGLYNPAVDSFVSRKPFNSWLFNPSSFEWEPPIPFPEDGGSYEWDEGHLAWNPSPSKAK